jgi:hypothetical protein
VTSAHPPTYRDALALLDDAAVPHLVGGAYALRHYTGIERETKDLDLFVRRGDVERGLAALRAAGFETELTSAAWLAKATRDDHLVDLIFASDNGVAVVDDLWFAHAESGAALDRDIEFIPVEEMIWSKAFVMERHRFDGADVTHLIRARGDRLDWERLVTRFGANWRVLLAHLVLFGFVYPRERAAVPPDVVADLVRRLEGEDATPPEPAAICRGTLLSREQYRVDVERWGYRDARELTRT